jgi:hypothetical protein
MSKVVYAQPVSAVSGTLRDLFPSGAVVALAPSRWGRVLREWVKPTDTPATLKSLIRGYSSAASVAFAGLTAAKAAGWTELGNNVTFDRSDSLQQIYHPSGINAHNAVNILRQMNGQALADTAPAAAAHYSGGAITLSTLKVAAPQELIINLTNSSIPNGYIGVLRISQNLSGNTQARKNDCALPTETPANAFAVAAGGVCAWTVVPRHTLALGRIGLTIRIISSTYIPGPVVLFPSVTLVAP